MQALHRLAQLLARSQPAILLQPQQVGLLSPCETKLSLIREHQRWLHCSLWRLHAAEMPPSEDEVQRKAVSDAELCLHL
jgi:hypothetical protein